ncbi:hypothetical protein JZ751_019417 [Albula glossodonta]|uniref:Hexosyltransferase n=1 Tax=Albula glossodonta TaxID=121402 RepID=A0A8T2NKQ3_9TELE|nr:hypothetical protein JZ751_019417 [Albula glossodonta]
MMVGNSLKEYFGLLLGVVVGFALASRFILPRAKEMHMAVMELKRSGGGCYRGARPNHSDAPLWQTPDNGSLTTSKPLSRASNFLFVGVMTAQMYLNNRAIAAHRTWAQTVPGRVEFFSSQGSNTSLPLPLVALHKVDDSYPPQKKSFVMLKYIHDHYLEQYEWFMRADDDVYIRTERLENLLRGLNSSEPILLGQPGTGTLDEVGTLALEPGENFCMGGPGVVLSREVLRRIAPHIGQCLREMHTHHEDVELGRCVRKFAGVQCVWSYEMQKLFYQNYEPEKKGFIQDLRNKKLYSTITLHPNKSPRHQYRLHNHMLIQKITKLRSHTVQLHREMLQLSHLVNTEPSKEDLQLGKTPSLTIPRPLQQQDILDWEFFNKTHIYSTDDTVPPCHGLSASLKIAIDIIIEQVMETLNAHSKVRGRVVEFKQVEYGYRRVNALQGAEYVLDLLMLYQKLKGQRKEVAMLVRRHAYLLQPFSRMLFWEEEELGDPVELENRINSDSGPISFVFKSLQKLIPFQLGSATGSSSSDLGPSEETVVNILVSLWGRYEAFVRFMDNYERVCLATKQRVKLLVLVFGLKNERGGAESSGGGAEDERDRSENERGREESGRDVAERQIMLISEYRRKHPWADIQVQSVAGPFSRALALQLGSAYFSNNSLLLYCDVDLIFNADFLKRCRDNTILGQQTYFPVVFSQYDPKLVYAERPPNDNQYVFTSKTGLWRYYGFGMACAYKGDMDRAGGFDVSLKGWGLEDVDLYNKFVQSGIRVFRSIDPGAIHVHHPMVCDPQLDTERYNMCLGSRGSSFASTEQLAQLWLDKNQQQGAHTANNTPTYTT